jgi:hypothetical protein
MLIEFFSYAHSEYGAPCRPSENTFFGTRTALLVILHTVLLLPDNRSAYMRVFAFACSYTFGFTLTLTAHVRVLCTRIDSPHT